MSKKYTLETIKDIEKVVNVDNVECFKKDFCKWLDIMCQIKEQQDTLEYKAYFGDFTWIDDGKNDATINVEIITT